MKSFVAIVLVFGIVSVSAIGPGCCPAWEPVNECGCGGNDGEVGGTLVDDCGPQPQPETSLTRIFGRPIQIKPDDAELVLSPSPIIVKPTLIHQSSPVVIRPTIISRPQPSRVSVAQPIFRVQNEVQRLPALQATGGIIGTSSVIGTAGVIGTGCGTQGIMSAYGPGQSGHGAGKHY